MQDRGTVGPAGWRTVIIEASRVATGFVAAIRRIAGMPDYLGHVEHLRRFHPQVPIPTERQYYTDFVRARYGDGPTRCC